MSRPRPSYALCLLPPTKKGGDWFGYAKDDDWSTLLDGGDDPTPDKTRAGGKTPGECATFVWQLVTLMEEAKKPKKPKPLAIKTYLVRFKSDPTIGASGYNTVSATNQKDAEIQAKAMFGEFGIASVALPKPGEIEALDEFWASQFR